MRRYEVEPRPNHLRLVQSEGLAYADDPDPETGEEPYWPDDRYYSFTSDEIELLDQAGEDVHAMLCEATDWLLSEDDNNNNNNNASIITEKMGVPEFALPAIRDSWARDGRGRRSGGSGEEDGVGGGGSGERLGFGSLYGRFDVCFGGLDHAEPRYRVPKFYEFNADTPTTVAEATTVQWSWLEETGLGRDQWNETYERLVAAWRRTLAAAEREAGREPGSLKVHFAMARGERWGEDIVATSLMLGACQEAGRATKTLFVDQIRKQASTGRFFDRDNEHIDVIFKLYPWEWMIHEEFGRDCLADGLNVGKQGRRHPETGSEDPQDVGGGTLWIEPPYKLLWSNKAIWAVMWQLFKDDPRSRWLIPTYFDGEQPAELTRYARKSIFGRKGKNTEFHRNGEVVDKGRKAVRGFLEKDIIQEMCPLPEFVDSRGRSRYPCIGLWTVEGVVSGLGIREDGKLITDSDATFVPHSISDGPVNYKRRPVTTLEEIERRFTAEHYAKAPQDTKGVLDYIERATESIRIA